MRNVGGSRRIVLGVKVSMSEMPGCDGEGNGVSGRWLSLDHVSYPGVCECRNRKRRKYAAAFSGTARPNISQLDTSAASLLLIEPVGTGSGVVSSGVRWPCLLGRSEPESERHEARIRSGSQSSHNVRSPSRIWKIPSLIVSLGNENRGLSHHHACLPCVRIAGSPSWGIDSLARWLW